MSNERTIFQKLSKRREENRKSNYNKLEEGNVEDNEENKLKKQLKGVMEALRVSDDVVDRFEKGDYNFVCNYLKEEYGVNIDLDIFDEEETEDKENNVNIDDGNYQLIEGKKIAVMEDGFTSSDKSKWNKDLIIFDSDDDLEINKIGENKNQIKFKILCDELGISKEIYVDRDEVNKILEVNNKDKGDSIKEGNMRFQYSCIQPRDKEELEYIIENAEEITFEEFRESVDEEDIERFNNQFVISLEEDNHISFWESETPNGEEVVYFIHSHVEYVFY